MSQDIADMPGMEDAMARFASVEESANASPASPTPPPDTREPKSPDAQAAAKGEAQNSDSQSPDTRAAADPKPAVTETVTDKANSKPGSTKAEQPTEPKPEASKTEPEKSRYAKSQERLTKTWDQVNAEKAAVAAEKARLESEGAELARKRAEFDAIRQQAEQPQFKPEDYQAAAQQKRALADHQRAEAKRLEDAGKFGEAEKLNKQAAKNDALAEDMQEHAENLRRNPPKAFTERAQQYEHAKQAWTVEAAKAYPDLAKDGSEFQRNVAAHLNALAKSDPQLLAHPASIYHAARLTHLEMRAKAFEAEAARVPVLTKEAESLRARIKELEALTTPAGGGSVARVGGQPAEDDLNSLRQSAMEAGALFR